LKIFLRDVLNRAKDLKFVLSPNAAPVMRIRRFFQAMDAVKLAWVLSGLFAAFVTVPNQTLELYRHAALEAADAYHLPSADRWTLAGFEGYLGGFIVIIAIAFVSFAFLKFAELLLRLNGARNSVEYGKLVPALLSCTPYLAVSLGLNLARVQIDQELISTLKLGAILSFERTSLSNASIESVAGFDATSQLEINWWLHAGSLLLLGLAVLAFLISIQPNRRSAAFSAALSHNKRLIWLGLTLPIWLSLAFIAFPVSLARAITPFGIIALFFCVVSIFLMVVAVIEFRVRLPILFMFIACALAFSFLNDNHGIRQLTATENSAPIPASPSVGEGFRQWLAARKDKDLYQEYPVYIVAAEGGGIYAAFRAATFLASVQDICPRFSHHLFAISSVSGGSVGAAVFSGLTTKIQPADGRFDRGNGCLKPGDKFSKSNFSDVAESILQDDFLSPVLAAFLFPDFLQRFLFFPVPVFDHSIALEKSLESSWDSGTQYFQEHWPKDWIDRGNPLRDSFFKGWNPAADTPALFMNTTEVGCGRGRVISPLSINSADISNVPTRTVNSENGSDVSGVDVSMSTAAILSARFPWLTPPGWFYEKRVSPVECGAPGTPSLEKIHLVDGGYIDNSGITTSLKIIDEVRREIEDAKLQPGVKINLIVLTSRGFVYTAAFEGDYLAPFQTLLSTRSARGEIAIEQAELRFPKKAGETKAASLDPSIIKFELQGFGYPLPLGWRLSPITRLSILGQNGDPRRCPAAGKQPDDTAAKYDCSTVPIYREMQR
jgi:hypothetical protein